MELYRKYYPITATPGKRDSSYREYEPCNALKPYVRCYWGTEKPIIQSESDSITSNIVTSDTCVDIMFTVNFTDNLIYSGFCGLQDKVFISQGSNTIGKKIFQVGIRFYAWEVSAFSEDSLKNTKNKFCNVDNYFSKINKEIQGILYEISDMNQFIYHVERILMKHLNDNHKNKAVMQSVCKIIEKKGNIPIKDLNQYITISDRQLERLYREYIGVSPKTFALMVRYQYVWKTILLHKNVKMLDLVYEFGYSDQSHLLHEFKKYHGMNISKAKSYAYGNVENIQEIIL